MATETAGSRNPATDASIVAKEAASPDADCETPRRTIAVHAR